MQALHDIVESVLANCFPHLPASSMHELLAENLVKARVEARPVPLRASLWRFSLDRIWHNSQLLKQMTLI